MKTNKIIFKATAFILIQAFICLDFGWTMTGEEESTLSPRLSIGEMQGKFQEVYVLREKTGGYPQEVEIGSRKPAAGPSVADTCLDHEQDINPVIEKAIKNGAAVAVDVAKIDINKLKILCFDGDKNKVADILLASLTFDSEKQKDYAKQQLIKHYGREFESIVRRITFLYAQAKDSPDILSKRIVIILSREEISRSPKLLGHAGRKKGSIYLHIATIEFAELGKRKEERSNESEEVKKFNQMYNGKTRWGDFKALLEHEAGDAARGRHQYKDKIEQQRINRFWVLCSGIRANAYAVVDSKLPVKLNEEKYFGLMSNESAVRILLAALKSDVWAATNVLMPALAENVSRLNMNMAHNYAVIQDSLKFGVSYGEMPILELSKNLSLLDNEFAAQMIAAGIKAYPFGATHKLIPLLGKKMDMLNADIANNFTAVVEALTRLDPQYTHVGVSSFFDLLEDILPLLDIGFQQPESRQRISEIINRLRDRNFRMRKVAAELLVAIAANYRDFDAVLEDAVTAVIVNLMDTNKEVRRSAQRLITVFLNNRIASDELWPALPATIVNLSYGADNRGYHCLPESMSIEESAKETHEAFITNHDADRRMDFLLKFAENSQFFKKQDTDYKYQILNFIGLFQDELSEAMIGLINEHGLTGLLDAGGAPQRRLSGLLGGGEFDGFVNKYQEFILEAYGRTNSERFHTHITAYIRNGAYFERGLYQRVQQAIRDHNNLIGVPSFTVGDIAVSRYGMIYLTRENKKKDEEKKDALHNNANQRHIPVVDVEIPREITEENSINLGENKFIYGKIKWPNYESRLLIYDGWLNNTAERFFQDLYVKKNYRVKVVGISPDYSRVFYELDGELVSGCLDVSTSRQIINSVFVRNYGFLAADDEHKQIQADLDGYDGEELRQRVAGRMERIIQNFQHGPEANQEFLDGLVEAKTNMETDRRILLSVLTQQAAIARSIRQLLAGRAEGKGYEGEVSFILDIVFNFGPQNVSGHPQALSKVLALINNCLARAEDNPGLLAEGESLSVEVHSQEQDEQDENDEPMSEAEAKICEDLSGLIGMTKEDVWLCLKVIKRIAETEAIDWEESALPNMQANIAWLFEDEEKADILKKHVMNMADVTAENKFNAVLMFIREPEAFKQMDMFKAKEDKDGTIPEEDKKTDRPKPISLTDFFDGTILPDIGIYGVDINAAMAEISRDSNFLPGLGQSGLSGDYKRFIMVVCINPKMELLFEELQGSQEGVGVFKPKTIVPWLKLGLIANLFPEMIDEILPALINEDRTLNRLIHPFMFGFVPIGKAINEQYVTTKVNPRLNLRLNPPQIAAIGSSAEETTLNKLFGLAGKEVKPAGRSLVHLTPKEGINYKFMNKDETVTSFFFEPYVFEQLTEQNNASGRPYTGIVPVPVRNKKGGYVFKIKKEELENKFDTETRENLFVENGYVYCFGYQADADYFDYQQGLNQEDAIGYFKNLAVLFKEFGLAHLELSQLYHNREENREHSLHHIVVGRINDPSVMLRFPNLRGRGTLADYSLDHFAQIPEEGLRPMELADIVRTQLFQLALFIAERYEAQGKSDEEYEQVLSAGVKEYFRIISGRELSKDEEINFGYYARHIMDGFRNKQPVRGGARISLGYPNAALSIHGLVDLVDYISLLAAKDAISNNYASRPAEQIPSALPVSAIDADKAVFLLVEEAI